MQFEVFPILSLKKILNNFNIPADEAQALQDSKMVQDESNDSHKVRPASFLFLF